MNSETPKLYIAGSAVLALMILMLWLSMRPSQPPASVAPAVSTPNPRQIYAASMQRVLNSYELDLAGLGKLLIAYELDPGLALDADWAGSLRSVTRRLEATGNNVRQIEPPAAMLPLHRELLQVEKWVTYAAHAAPDRLAVEYISSAADHMEKLAALLESRDWSAMPTPRPASAPAAEDSLRSIGVRVTVTPTLGAVLGKDTDVPIFPTPTP